MSRLTVQLFDLSSELVDFTETADEGLEITLKGTDEGYLSLCDITVRVERGRCNIPLCRIPDGEHTPYLTLADRRIALPSLIKKGVTLRVRKYTAEDILSLSLEIKKYGDRLRRIEKRLKIIEERVCGRALFDFTAGGKEINEENK